MSITVYLNYIAKAFSFAKEEKNELTVHSAMQFVYVQVCGSKLQPRTVPVLDLPGPGPFQPRTVTT